MKQRKGSTIKRPLVVKLIGIISAIVLVSTATVTSLSAWFFLNDTRTRLEDNNLTMSLVMASQLEGEFRSVKAGVLSLFDTIRENGGNGIFEEQIIGNFFYRNPSVAYMEAPGLRTISNDNFFIANELSKSVAALYLAGKSDIIERAIAGETLVCNASTAFGVPAALLAFPYSDFGTRSALVILFSTERFQEIVQSGTSGLPFVVDSEGRLLAHPDFDFVRMGLDCRDDELVSAMLASPLGNRQIRYTDDEGNDCLGAFRKLSVGQVGIAVSTPAALVYEAALSVVRQSLFLAGTVLVLSILAVWFFSKSVTRPVLRLVSASREIENGNFELDLAPESKDELGLLTESFVHMGRGLAERERVKETFGKFVNARIAEQALTGHLKLGGERKTATIFFSDIRSFTAISEKLSPEEVVDFLNAYMTLMVDCIEQTGGVVDKFIGDAIMAVWGAPVSRGAPEDDALQAVTAMFLMREALREFNRGRGGPGKPVIKIGCGVNTGPCLAGQIGSEKRMEYTVIGDAVNLASRIEALNKPFGTDILISRATYELVKDRVIAEKMVPVTVKGKTAPLTVYSLVNWKEGPGPRNLPELRESLGIQPPSRKVVAHDETKYEILA